MAHLSVRESTLATRRVTASAANARRVWRRSSLGAVRQRLRRMRASWAAHARACEGLARQDSGERLEGTDEEGWRVKMSPTRGNKHDVVRTAVGKRQAGVRDVDVGGPLLVHLDVSVQVEVLLADRDWARFVVGDEHRRNRRSRPRERLAQRPSRPGRCLRARARIPESVPSSEPECPYAGPTHANVRPVASTTFLLPAHVDELVGGVQAARHRDSRFIPSSPCRYGRSTKSARYALADGVSIR